MPRRYRPPRRVIAPDRKYNSETVAAFINNVMKNGKKSLAESLVYDAFEIVAAKTSKDPLEVFEQALRNVAPVIEVRPRRVGGATYQVPVEVPAHRRTSLAIRWILQSARGRSGKAFPEKLASELLDAAQNTGNAVKRREDTHRMAEANKAFAHYRW